MQKPKVVSLCLNKILSDRNPFIKPLISWLLIITGVIDFYFKKKLIYYNITAVNKKIHKKDIILQDRIVK